MSRDGINKHIEVFEHWRKGGTVLVSLRNTTMNTWEKWKERTDPLFFSTQARYLINDEYVKLRKALADGKSIQYNTSCNVNDSWEDLSLAHIFSGPISNYRIKPDTFTKRTTYINDGTGKVIFEEEEKVTEIPCVYLKKLTEIEGDAVRNMFDKYGL